MAINTTLKSVAIGSPATIDISENQYPSAELTVQSSANLTTLTLHDESSKCTKSGALVTAASLVKDIDHTINVDIQGNGKLTSDEIDAFFDILSKYISGSNIVGHATSDACYEDAANALHTRFPQFTIDALKYFVRFKDPEVLRVLLANAQHAYPGSFTTDELLNITDIGIWFQNNTAITSFNEFDKTNVMVLSANSFMGTTSLKSINLKNIITIESNAFRQSSVEKIYAPNATHCNGAIFRYNDYLKCCFLPKIERLGQGAAWAGTFRENPKLKIVDLGENINYIEGVIFYGNNIAQNNLVVRNQNSFVFGADNAHRYIFVPAEKKEEYKSKNPNYSSVIFSIGETEWQTIMQQLATEEGYTLKPGESWADEYIDYKIYGVEPPSE